MGDKVVGDIARQAAATPRADRAAGTTPAPVAIIGNRFDAMFSSVTFKPAAATAKVYGKNDKDEIEDRASKKLASVVVGLTDPTRPGEDSGAYIMASIKAVQNKGQNAPVAEFLFMASQFGGQCIKAETADAQRELDDWRRRQAQKYVLWRKANGGGAAPVAAGVPLDDIDSL